MIVSNRHRFVFFQVPYTASSFLGNFFSRKFGGKSVLQKHITYAEFLDVATQEQRSYRTIIGKRHPLDKLVTFYMRSINRSGIRHGNTEEMRSDFERWFRTKFRQRLRTTPHVVESYPFVDYVISQENLVQDLNSVLEAMGVDSVHVPKWEKRTKNKLDDYTRYYPDSLIPFALDILKNEMSVLKYEAPASWQAFSP